MKTTYTWLNERHQYISRKLDWSVTYSHKIFIFLLENERPFIYNVGYCGEGDSACLKESLSSKLVPDFKSKNRSCWSHDRLGDGVKGIIKGNKKEYIISKEHADKYFYYSMLYDAGWNPVKRLTAFIYYQSVKNVAWDKF